MSSSNTFGIKFLIRLSKQMNDSATVFARISVNGRRCQISLKEKDDPKVATRLRIKAGVRKTNSVSLIVVRPAFFIWFGRFVFWVA